MIFIYFKLLSLCFCIQKACFPIPLIICLLSQTKYTLITLEILIAFIFSHVEQTFVDFLFVFEDLSFTIHLIKKFRIVRVLVLLGIFPLGSLYYKLVSRDSIFSIVHEVLGSSIKNSSYRHLDLNLLCSRPFCEYTTNGDEDGMFLIKHKW